MNNSIYTRFDPRSMIKDVLRECLSILMIALAAGLLTILVVDYTYKPQYRSQAILVVSGKADTSYTYKNLEAAAQVAEKFAQILDGTLLRKAVAEDLGLPALSATTRARLVPETNMIELSVIADRPDQAFRIIRSILDNYPKVSDYLVGSVNMVLLEQPRVSTAPINARNPMGAARQAFLAVLVLAAAFIALCSQRRDTVKNVEQYRKNVDARSLGIIYHERKSNLRMVSKLGLFFGAILDLLPIRLAGSKSISMLITNPRRSYFYLESNKMAASMVRNRMDREHAKVALVTSVLENEGKSTVCSNLALGIAQEGKKVLLIDADFRKPSLFKIFQLEETMRVNLIWYLADPEYSEDPAKPYKDTNLHLIANYKSAKSSDAEVNLKNLKQIIDAYRDKMDYIFLDSAPMALVSDTEALADLADASILVTREDRAVTEQINDSIDILNQNGAYVLGCIFNDAHRSLLTGTTESYGRYGGYYGR